MARLMKHVREDLGCVRPLVWGISIVLAVAATALIVMTIIYRLL